MAGNFDVDLNRSVRDILDDVRMSAVGAFNNRNVALAVPPFAALLVKLSEEASTTAETVKRLTKGLFWLTVALFVLTFVLLLMQAYQLWTLS